MVPLVVSEEMIGYKFGEFIPTRTRAVFKKKDKKKK
jgi:ribosomal protein S19